MQEVIVKHTGSVSAEIDFLVQKSEVEAELNKFCNEIKGRVLVDGFRKGTAPMSVIRQKFASEIKVEVSSRLVGRKTEAAFKEKGLKVTGNPALKKQYKVTKNKQWLGHFKLDGAFEFGVEVELEPTVEITNYTDIEVEVDLPEPKAWMDGRLKEFQNNFAERTQVMRPIQAGDEVALDFTAGVNGEKLDGGAAKFYTTIVGSGGLTPEFEDSLIGKVPGTHVDFEVKFADNFPEVVIAGKTVQFSVNIHTATEIVPHQINDELAQKAVYQSVVNMMEELEMQASEEYEKPRKAKQFEAVMTIILERNPFVVPNSWVDNEILVIAQKLGMKALPADAAQLNSLREIAVRSVQQSFVLDRIYAKEEALRITGDEIEAMLAKEAERAGRTTAEVLAHLKNSGTYEGFVSYAEHMKTTDFLVGSSKIKDKK